MWKTVTETYSDAWIVCKNAFLVCIEQSQEQVVALLLGHKNCFYITNFVMMMEIYMITTGFVLFFHIARAAAKP